jgi:hypothetical protein
MPAGEHVGKIGDKAWIDGLPRPLRRRQIPADARKLALQVFRVAA